MTAPVATPNGRDTLLVVDDEADILVAIEDLFEDDYTVVATTSPAQALDWLQAGMEAAVILSDQRMPGMTGDAFLERARAYSDADAILLTGYADLSAVIRAVNRGGIVGYVPKPWDAAVLRSMVAAAVERRRLARQLDTERALLHGLLESVGDAISFKDREGRFVRLNTRKADELGGATVGERESTYLDAERAADVEEAERAVVASRAGSETVAPVITEAAEGAAAATRWLSTRRYPILDAEGEVRYIVTLERDVTEQKMLESRLRHADKMQALGTLAGGIAHDFNNLLTAILGNLDLAARRVGDNPRVSRLLGNATHGAQRAAALTQRLLSFSRRRDLNPRTVNPNDVITGMEDLLRQTLGNGVRSERRLAPDLWATVIDPDELELAILNLCINARDAMPNGGVLTITSENRHVAGDEVTGLRRGDYAVVVVEDTGGGMPPEIQARAFEPFFTTKDTGKGTGLGLSMVYGLLQRIGGTVTIDSAPGRGTRIVLHLPRGTAPSPAAAGAPAVPPTRRARILVVDDDPAVRSVTAAFLGDFGHDVREAESGPQALRALERDAIDLVVTDVAMPGMTGLQLATRVRERWPRLPILLVTGYAELPEVPEDFAVMHKPFQREDLAARVAELIA